VAEAGIMRASAGRRWFRGGAFRTGVIRCRRMAFAVTRMGRANDERGFDTRGGLRAGRRRDPD